MKKVILISVLLGTMCWLGCGGDDDPVGPEPDTTITITPATGSAAPARLSVDDAIWNGIAATNVPIVASSFSAAAKQRPNTALAVADGMEVKALVVSNTLYLRVAWDDATWDCWPGKFEVTSFAVGSGWAQFTRGPEVEDQMMVLFNGGLEYGWDVWHWRAATTGGGYLAEGAVLNGQTLTVDPGDNDLIMLNHDPGFSIPNYMHPEGPVNQSYQLLEADADTMVVDTDSLTARYGETWAMGDLVPGYVIDGLKYMENPALRGDRFDIASFASRSSGGYVVVLSRALNTGSESDLSLTGSVDVRLGITNNRSFLFNAGSSDQGFSNTFRINLP